MANGTQAQAGLARGRHRQAPAVGSSEVVGEVPWLVGRHVLWTYDDGPMAGKTFEHAFPAEGGVRFRMVDGARKGRFTEVAERGMRALGPDVAVVSYVSGSGYTLTTCLDRASGRIVSVASSETDWGLQSGSFTLQRKRPARGVPAADRGRRRAVGRQPRP